MGVEQIIVQVNPDVTPNGSDLAVVNAARKSFGKRSELEVLSYSEMGRKLDEVSISDYTFVGHGIHGRYERLKPQDKRLIEFLARGMTTDDFEGFMDTALTCGGGRQGLWDQVPELFDDSEEHLSYYNEFKDLLWKWRHTPEHISPFGHCFLSFEIKVPMFLARQLVKHKFLRWSEYSRRYITYDVEFYQHDYREASEDKKQGSGGPHPSSEDWKRRANCRNEDQLELYNAMVKDGVAPEQARGVLPADLMTAVTWSGSLDAFTNMCRLRLGSDSQVEAQHVAKEVYKVLLEHYPVSAKSLVEGV